METKCNQLRSLAVQAKEYFTLVDKPLLTGEEQLRVKMYRETLAQNNIESHSDYDYLKTVIVEAGQKATPIKEQYNRCANFLKKYSEIAATYRESSQGDYISQLIEHQREQDTPQACLQRLIS